MLPSLHLSGSKAWLFPGHIVARAVEEQVHVHLAATLGRILLTDAGHCPHALHGLPRRKVAHATIWHFRWRRDVRHCFLLF
ncbi:hypothetical protein D3C72_2023960 [compost metagenome]